MFTGAIWHFSNAKSMSKRTRAPEVAVIDSYAWVEPDYSYYIYTSNTTNMAAINAMRDLKDYTSLSSFFKRNADTVKPENAGLS